MFFNQKPEKSMEISIAYVQKRLKIGQIIVEFRHGSLIEVQIHRLILNWTDFIV